MSNNNQNCEYDSLDKYQNDNDDEWTTVTHKTWKEKKRPDDLLHEEWLKKQLYQKKIQHNKHFFKSSVDKVLLNKKNNKNTMTNIKKIEKMDEEGNLRLNKIEMTYGQKMKDSRMKKDWSQKELAFKCNLPMSVIQKYEKGEAIQQDNEIMIINRLLNIKK